MVNRKDKKTEKPDYQSLNIDFVKYKTFLTDKYQNRKIYTAKDLRLVTAFIPGTIKKIFVTEGDKVKEGDRLLELDAMKMKNIVISPINGEVKSINVSSKDIVSKNHVLINLEYDEPQSE